MDDRTGRKEGPPLKRLMTLPRGKMHHKIEYKNDRSYSFVEAEVEVSKEPCEFHPLHFLRTHSKNNDPADVQTQIWQCLFEPDIDAPHTTTNIVATCGGSSVCFIDVESGSVVLKYISRNTKTTTGVDNLYALAWSSIPLDDIGIKRMNILAAAGARSTVLLIHPEAGVCYETLRTVPNKVGAVICSLIFHPKKATWLFCGHEDGHIQIWDVDTPTMPDYTTMPTHIMTIPAVARDVYNFAYSQTHDSLIAGCDGGLFAWKIDMDKMEKKERLDCTEILLPDIDGNGIVLDSVCMVRDDLLAAKCALHGQIYILSLSRVLKSARMNKSGSRYEVDVKEESMLRLRWSDTDNYYMNMGADPKSCILVCGDDKGSLWVYDIASYVTGDIKSPLNGGSQSKLIEPEAILEWPELEDPEVEKARKLKLDTYDIVIDKCNVSPGGNHIVAVTSNNMVCIWKRGKQEDDSDDD